MMMIIIFISPEMKITKSQTGDFNRAKGKEVMEAFIKSEGTNINAVYAHNDDMGLGAIEAIEAAGLVPGDSVLRVNGRVPRDVIEAAAMTDPLQRVLLGFNVKMLPDVAQEAAAPVDPGDATAVRARLADAWPTMTPRTTRLPLKPMALTIGILFGIYSSVFVAAAIAMWLGIKREDLVKEMTGGIGPDVCLADNPRLVYATLSGYGFGNSFTEWPGNERNAQGMSGVSATS